MAVGNKQKLITSIIESVFSLKIETNKRFPWLVNKHVKEDFGKSYKIIEKIFADLKGNKEAIENKAIRFLQPDGYVKKFNCLFEFDEFQHFSICRLISLNHYPDKMKLGFDISVYKELCQKHNYRADSYRRNKTTKEFPYIGGRTAQRAYLDSFRDLLPEINGLNPTIRISEFEVEDINDINAKSRELIEKLILEKNKYTTIRKNSS